MKKKKIALVGIKSSSKLWMHSRPTLQAFRHVQKLFWTRFVCNDIFKKKKGGKLFQREDPCVPVRPVLELQYIMYIIIYYVYYISYTIFLYIISYIV